MYAAANWSYVGNSKGYAHATVTTPIRTGSRSGLYVRALRDDAREILRQSGELAACWQARALTTGGRRRS